VVHPVVQLAVELLLEVVDIQHLRQQVQLHLLVAVEEDEVQLDLPDLPVAADEGGLVVLYPPLAQLLFLHL
jgi:hypothetical protein